MRRHHPLRFPSLRNLLIYHELTYENVTQVKLAARLGVSQRRVSQVGQQVRAWVDSIVPPRQFMEQPGLRLHLAVANERVRLRDAYEPLIGMFTGTDGEPRYLRKYIKVVAGEAVSTVEIYEKPDHRLMGQAVNVAGRLAELEAIANRGPFANLPNEVHETITHRLVSASGLLAGSPSSASPDTDSPATTNTTENPSNVHEIR